MERRGRWPWLRTGPRADRQEPTATCHGNPKPPSPSSPTIIIAIEPPMDRAYPALGLGPYRPDTFRLPEGSPPARSPLPIRLPERPGGGEVPGFVAGGEVGVGAVVGPRPGRGAGCLGMMVFHRRSGRVPAGGVHRAPAGSVTDLTAPRTILGRGDRPVPWPSCTRR